MAHRSYDGTFVPVREKSPADVQHKVRPKDIKEHIYGVFGKTEVEVSAGKLVAFFKERGFWCGFTLEEFGAFCTSRGWVLTDALFGIAFTWYDVADEDSAWREPADIFIVHEPQEAGGQLCVTDRFIERCADVP